MEDLKYISSKGVHVYIQDLSLIHIFLFDAHGISNCSRYFVTVLLEIWIFSLANAFLMLSSPVSYTHLDVYKRQVYGCTMFNSFYEFTYIQCVLIGAMCGYS